MNLPINRLRKVFIFGPEKNRGALDSIEIRCQICGEKIICAGDNWTVIKKAFIKRVLHHSWGHQKYEWNGKKKLDNNFQFEFPYRNIATERKTEDTLFNQSMDDTHESLREKVLANPKLARLIELQKKKWTILKSLALYPEE